MGFSDITNLHIALRQDGRARDVPRPRLRLDGDPRAHAVHLGLRGRGVHERRHRRGAPRPRRPLRAHDRGRPRHGADRRREPLHVRPPARHAVGPGLRRGDPVLRGGRRAAVHRRGPPAPARRSPASSQNVAGVVVGELFELRLARGSRPEAPRTRSIEDVLERCLLPLGVPVLYKLPLGHGKHLASMPLGVQATLDADAQTLTIDQPGVHPRRRKRDVGTNTKLHGRRHHEEGPQRTLRRRSAG